MLEMLTLELKIGDQHTHTWFVWALHLFIVSVFSSAFAAMKSEGISLFSRTTHRFGVGPYNSRTFAVYSDWDLQQWELRGCSVYKHVQRITFKYNLSIAPHQIMESLSMLYNIIFLSFVILPGGVCVSSIQLSFNDIIYVHHFYWLRSFVFFFSWEFNIVVEEEHVFSDLLDVICWAINSVNVLEFIWARRQWSQIDWKKSKISNEELFSFYQCFLKELIAAIDFCHWWPALYVANEEFILVRVRL